MPKQDRELLYQLRIVNQSLAASVIELLDAIENADICPDALRQLADNLEAAIDALRVDADELADAVDADRPVAPVVELCKANRVVAASRAGRSPRRHLLQGWADR